MYVYFLALKYLLSRPINLLSMFGVMVAVWALIVIVSIFSGFIVKMEEHIQGATSDLAFIHVGSAPRADLELLETLLEADPEVQSFAPRLVWHGLLDHPGRDEFDLRSLQRGPERDFVQIIGVDQDRERSVSKLDAWVEAVQDKRLRATNPSKAFETSADDDLPGMLLGIPRARDLGISRGTILTLVSGQQDRNEDVNRIQERFRFAGCWSSDFYHFDENTALVPLSAMRRIFGRGRPAWQQSQLYNEISIQLVPGADIVRAKKRLQASFDQLSQKKLMWGGVFQTWRDRNRNFLQNVQHQKFLMRLMLFVLVIVAGFLIFATLSMMVVEKIRDIGILSALGGTRTGVLVIFAFSGLAIALIGSALGVATAVLTCAHLNDFNVWLKDAFDIHLFRTSVYGLKEVPHQIEWAWVGIVCLVTLGLSSLSAIIPGFRAARMDPVKALRHEL